MLSLPVACFWMGGTCTKVFKVLCEERWVCETLPVAVQGEGADDVLKEMWQRKLKSLRCVAQLCRWGEARCKSGNAAKQA